MVSIVAASILTSIEGKFGDEHWKGNARTRGSKLFINPLMSMYWAFDNHGVYERIHPLFKQEWAKATDSANQIRRAVRNARSAIRESDDFIAKHEDYPFTTDLKH